MEYIITFNNTNSAIKAEQLLLAENLHVGVMPLPSQIRAGCGICLRLTSEEIGVALRILDKNSIRETDLFSRTAFDNNFIYSEVTDRSNISIK